MKTIKQQKASRRNFMLMSIVGMITVLNLFDRQYVRSFIYKRYLADAISTLRDLHRVIINIKDSNPKNYLDGFYSNNEEYLLDKQTNSNCK